MLINTNSVKSPPNYDKFDDKEKKHLTIHFWTFNNFPANLLRDVTTGN